MAAIVMAIVAVINLLLALFDRFGGEDEADDAGRQKAEQEAWNFLADGKFDWKDLMGLIAGGYLLAPEAMDKLTDKIAETAGLIIEDAAETVSTVVGSVESGLSKIFKHPLSWLLAGAALWWFFLAPKDDEKKEGDALLIGSRPLAPEERYQVDLLKKNSLIQRALQQRYGGQIVDVLELAKQTGQTVELVERALNELEIEDKVNNTGAKPLDLEAETQNQIPRPSGSSEDDSLTEGEYFERTTFESEFSDAYSDDDQSVPTWETPPSAFDEETPSGTDTLFDNAWSGTESSDYHFDTVSFDDSSYTTNSSSSTTTPSDADLVTDSPTPPAFEVTTFEISTEA